MSTRLHQVTWKPASFGRAQGRKGSADCHSSGHVTQQTLLTDVSVVGKDTLGGLWQAPVGEYQHRSLEFWNKAMPSAGEIIHCLKNSFSVLWGPGRTGACDQSDRGGLERTPCEDGESASRRLLYIHPTLMTTIGCCVPNRIHGSGV